ncbi:NUDIX domain-containing protein [Traorella massiliensis]|uniref:NAD(+) diphosphatase n=1 Tax=Traorella massiliensis TaxID=1903263 RepID=UPI00248E5EA7|nr:NUDIX domain-containing protein [Traorella massiliensis]
MKYCVECGTKLIYKELENEGMIPYCEKCHEYRFPIFSSAVSMIILNPQKDKILLIKQYGRPFYILVAGYINKGENALEAVKREVFEEVHLHVHDLSFNSSEYFEPTNTCMFNFSCISDSEDFSLTNEVDEAAWFTFEEARQFIKENSLAKRFLIHYLDHQ